jgi:hypothetical protein
MAGKKMAALAHASLLIREFLVKNETTVVPQPPYTPDLLYVSQAQIDAETTTRKKKIR